MRSAQSELVDGAPDHVHTLAVGGHVHMGQRVVAQLVAEKVPLQEASGGGDFGEGLEVLDGAVEVSHDDAADVGAGVGEYPDYLHWGGIVASGVNQDGCACLALGGCRRSERLSLVVGQGPRAADFADDSGAYSRAVGALSYVLDDLAGEVIFRAEVHVFGMDGMST